MSLVALVAILSSATYASALDAPSPDVAGTWSIEAGTSTPRAGSHGRIIDIRDARLRMSERADWVLAAERITLVRDMVGGVDWMMAHGAVRVVARFDDSAESSVYAMGEHAWIDPRGARGVLLGEGVGLIRDAWQMRGSKIDMDFGTPKLVLRGVTSGPVRTKRDDTDLLKRRERP